MSKAVCQLCGGPRGPDHVCSVHAQLVGKVLDGRYAIDGIIGQGGMGMVFRATQVSVKRPVAVKTLHPALAAAPQFFERFRREAEVASGLRHPHVITVYDFGKTSENICYFVMEMLEGESLKQLVKKGGPLSLRRSAELMEQTARGLAHAHQHGVIHRDLKPHNIMVSQLDGKDFVKVLDFGLVKALEPDEGEAQLTSTGQVLGTPQYMPPEQAGGDAVDIRSDLYALAGVFYFCLTGNSPFGANTVRKALTAALSGQLPPVSSRRQGAPVPKELEAFFKRALSKEKADRPQNCEEFIASLRAALSGCSGEELDARPPLASPIADSKFSAESVKPLTRGWGGGRKAPSSRSSGSVVVVQSGMRMFALLRRASRGAKRLAQAGARLLSVLLLLGGVVGGIGWGWGKWSKRSSKPGPLKVAVPLPSAPPSPLAVALPLRTPLARPIFSLPSSRPVSVKVESVPTGAEVYEGKVLVGATPLVLALPRDRRYLLTFKREGFLAEERSLDLQGFSGSELGLPPVALKSQPHLARSLSVRGDKGPAAEVGKKEEAKKRKGKPTDMAAFE